jgi:hypothetical protein
MEIEKEAKIFTQILNQNKGIDTCPKWSAFPRKRFILLINPNNTGF